MKFWGADSDRDYDEWLHAFDEPGPPPRPRPTWRTVDGQTCLNCGQVLMQHRDQRYCDMRAVQATRTA